MGQSMICFEPDNAARPAMTKKGPPHSAWGRPPASAEFTLTEYHRGEILGQLQRAAPDALDQEFEAALIELEDSIGFAIRWGRLLSLV